MARMSGLKRTQARWLAVSFWCAIVSNAWFATRVYSWYLPFCILGMTAVWLAEASLKQKQFARAIGLGVLRSAPDKSLSLVLLLAGVWFAAITGVYLCTNEAHVFFGSRPAGRLGTIAASLG
jgi:hypothetical protein